MAVNYGESPEKVQQFAHRRQSIFLCYSTDTWKPPKPGVQVLPASFVLGQDGDIRYSAVGLLDWRDDEVLQLLTTLSLRP